MKNTNNKGKIFSFLILAITLISIANIKAQVVSAKIEKVWTEYDVYQNEQQGMKIHVNFSVNNMLNKTGQCNAYFYFKNGTALVDYNQRYHTKNGKVCSWYTFTPAHTNCLYDDFVIFMPYEELHLTGRHDLKFQIEILDYNLRSIAQSNFYDFWVEWGSGKIKNESDRKNENESDKKIENETDRKNENESVSLNRNYDWYNNQKNTGYASENNCGPACAAMAAKWSDKSFNKSVVDVRNTYPNNGNWWNMKNIHDFLINNNIPCVRFQDKISEAIIKKHLNNGSIVIVNINTKDITYNKNAEQRTGRYYNLEIRHFVIIKGYRVVDNKTEFEVYDPNTWDMYYSDGSPKGKDRYYRSNEVIYSILNLNSHYIVVSPK